MKILTLLFSLILASCASRAPLSDEVKLLSAHPVSVSSEDFSFSELILILKIDHFEKTLSKCEGIFPNDPKRQELINLYFAHKVDKNLKIERKQMVSIKDKQNEFVIYSIFNDHSLSSSVSACHRLILLYEQEGFKSK